MIRYIIVLSLSLLIAGCSTTKRLEEGDVLYIGVKKMNFVPADGVKINSDAKNKVKGELSVKPNNPFISPYIRSPFPFGLLIYNYCQPTKDKGFKYWFYNKFAKEPVLISTVNPSVRMKLVENTLQNWGYFNSNATYNILYKKKDDKKARILYTIDVAKGWSYGEIIYPEVTNKITALIDTMKVRSLLHIGSQYNTDTLQAERERISTSLRNNGYYFFRPEYIQYLADTTQMPYKVMLKVVLQDGIPPQAMRQYKIGKIDLFVASVTGKGEIDTLKIKGRHVNINTTVTYQQPKRIKWSLLRRSIMLRSGKVYSLSDQIMSQNNLIRTGIFRYVNLVATPVDSISSDTLNMRFDLAMSKPIEGTFEIDVNSKTNNFIGPNISFGLAHNNVFGGAESLALKLNGAYEWQTGANNTSGTALMNSYEFGATISLTFPRLLVPKFIRQPRNFMATTNFQIGADLLNRPKYFRMLSLNASMEYNFATSKVSSHTIIPFKLVYNKLLNTTDPFEQTLSLNPAVALSFRDQFIPMMRYVYVYNRNFGYKSSNRIYFRIEATQAGNLLDGIMRAFGDKGTKKLFGNQFSQFVKGQLEFKYFRRMWGENWLASRFMIGAGHAYSNSAVMPYSEQFYIGGANSIRAFTIRSIGPGSYRPNTD
ncbi:MAG: BamA/TamA family outer membrane protein, partial [Bacteroidales bacterium]